MVEIEKPRIECLENLEDSSYGKYVVEPLERGYGTTLGNSLRRILLSSRSISRPAASARSPPVTSRPTARWRSSTRTCTSPPWGPTPP